jgi:hypothetical protein
MRISLLLCLILTVTISVLTSNPSDLFNQNGSDIPKEIKTGIVKSNMQEEIKIKTDMVEPKKNYKILGYITGKNANKASELAGYAMALYMLCYGTSASGKQDGPSFPNLILATPFAVGAFINRLSAQSDEENPNMSNGLVLSNAVFGLANFVVLRHWQIVHKVVDEGVQLLRLGTLCDIPAYYLFLKGCLYTYNVVNQLYWGKKKQN